MKLWLLPMIIPRQSYRKMISLLRQFEPLRAWWRICAGALLLFAIPVLSLGCFILGPVWRDL
jgi:hypothetical protein